MNRREILFRGKRVDNGGWVEGNLTINEAAKAHRIVVGFGLTGDMEGECHVCFGEFHLVDPSTIGQLHNGLTRKAGSNVFVGDIIRHDLEAGLGQPKRIGEKSTVNSIEFDYHYYTNIRVVVTIHDTHLTKQS